MVYRSPLVLETRTIELRIELSYVKSMRPLFHPSMQDIRLETILYALSDPSRAAIFAKIASADSTQACSAFACMGDRVIPKSSLSQHFKILREAGLIRSERHGVEMHNRSRCREVDERFPGLILAILNAYARST